MTKKNFSLVVILWQPGRILGWAAFNQSKMEDNDKANIFLSAVLILILLISFLAIHVPH